MRYTSSNAGSGTRKAKSVSPGMSTVPPVVRSPVRWMPRLARGRAGGQAWWAALPKLQPNPSHPLP